MLTCVLLRVLSSSVTRARARLTRHGHSSNSLSDQKLGAECWWVHHDLGSIVSSEINCPVQAWALESADKPCVEQWWGNLICKASLDSQWVDPSMTINGHITWYVYQGIALFGRDCPSNGHSTHNRFYWLSLIIDHLINCSSLISFTIIMVDDHCISLTIVIGHHQWSSVIIIDIICDHHWLALIIIDYHRICLSVISFVIIMIMMMMIMMMMLIILIIIDHHWHHSWLSWWLTIIDNHYWPSLISFMIILIDHHRLSFTTITLMIIIFWHPWFHHRMKRNAPSTHSAAHERTLFLLVSFHHFNMYRSRGRWVRLWQDPSCSRRVHIWCITWHAHAGRFETNRPFDMKRLQTNGGGRRVKMTSHKSKVLKMERWTDLDLRLQY